MLDTDESWLIPFVKGLQRHIEKEGKRVGGLAEFLAAGG